MSRIARCLVALTCFLQVAAAAAIIVITAMKLHRVSISFDKQSYQADVSNVCLLGTTDNGANLCYFAYIVSGISIVATGILSLLQCCTCNLCGLGLILDGVFAAAGAVLWGIAGYIFDFYRKQPLMALVPRPEWRQSIPILAYAACALFGLMLLAAAYALLSTCCCPGSCGGSSRSSGKLFAGGGGGYGGGPPAYHAYPPAGGRW